MAHDVFISYSKRDRAVAESVCEALEQQNLRCWFALRDLLPGRRYPEELIVAIDQSQGLLLLLSEGANDSEFVYRECEKAVSSGKMILVARIEPVEPSAALEFFIRTSQWLDVFDLTPGQYLPKVADNMQKLLSESARLTPVELDCLSRTENPGENQAPERAEEGTACRKLAVLYKRQAQSDEALLTMLQADLTSRSYEVFIDRQVPMGLQWAAEIDRKIRSSDDAVQHRPARGAFGLLPRRGGQAGRRA